MSTRGIKRSHRSKTLAALLSVGVIASVAPVAANAAAPAAKAKNNLIIGIGEPNANWCSQQSPGVDQVAAKNSVLETLTIVNDKGKMVPYLAKSVVGSADKKTWTVTLREGIKYHDGETLTADNVIANMVANAGLSRVIFRAGELPSLPAIAWLDIMGSSIDELEPALVKQDAAALGAIVAKFQKFAVKKSDYVVEFNLATPRPNFLFLLWNYGRTALLSTTALKSSGCGTTPAGTVGTGPFKVKSKGAVGTTTDTILEANPDYWRSTAKNPLPKSQEVTFRILPNSTSKVNAVRTGNIDIATFGATEGNSLNTLKKMGKKVSLYAGPRDTAWTLHLNTVPTTGSPFANKNAREAFAQSLDRNVIVKVLTKGNADAASTIAPKMHPWHQPNQALKFDLKKAKASAAKYQQETGKKLEIVIPRNTTSASGELAEEMCKMTRKADIGCTVSPGVSSTEYILNGFGLKQHLSNFNVSAGNYADFALLFATKTRLELSGFRFTNPTLAQCFTTARDKSTKAAFAPCVKTLQTESFWIPLYIEGGFLAWNKTAEGVGATPLPGGGNRPLINASGFDFASVTKTK
jgi:ABC-type transport system substrate-binding protein